VLDLLCLAGRMSVITPWTSVYPADTPAAILGNLPMKQGTVSFAVPTSVVPADAAGILVFAWCAITGSNPGMGYWHVSVNLSGGGANFFSMIVVGAPHGERPTLFNSQAFWLPMPSDGNVNVTLAGADFPGPGNEGEVEIHGYLPAAASPSGS
jgi:hypothetical protein